VGEGSAELIRAPLFWSQFALTGEEMGFQLMNAVKAESHFNSPPHIPVLDVPVINPAGEMMTGKCGTGKWGERRGPGLFRERAVGTGESRKPFHLRLIFLSFMFLS
jgi:hypothetical protein